jgi:hypothetical protein
VGLTGWLKNYFVVTECSSRHVVAGFSPRSTDWTLTRAKARDYMITLFSVILLFASVNCVRAEDTAEAFLQRARSGTAKYQDQSIAILDGYRKIGRDFPSMGEHWIRLDLLFDGKIDAEHPEFLTYVTVEGRAKLMGVAYALPLLSKESPPDLPAPRDAWHDHYRTIEDETILPQHHLPATAASAPRITMLHAWIWTPNPDGVFAADNWAIPYVRTSLTPPEHRPRSGALALSLLSGGVEYFSATIDAILSPAPRQRGAIDAAFATARSSVERIVRKNEVDRLSEIWNELLHSLESIVGPRNWADVQARLPKD